MSILFLVYAALGYWATERTVYANKILVGSSSAIVGRKLAVGIVFGWALIPAALIKVIFLRG